MEIQKEIQDNICNKIVAKYANRIGEEIVRIIVQETFNAIKDIDKCIYIVTSDFGDVLFNKNKKDFCCTDEDIVG